MPTPSPIQLERAFRLPPEQAVKYLKGLGVEVTDNWRQQQAAIRRQAFTVAKVTQAGLLQTMLAELQKGLESGKPWDQWQRETGKLLESKGYARRPDGTAWRLDNIYRTNLQSAYQAGRFKQMQESTRFEYWEYRAVGDKRSRSEHRKLDGLILHRDHPFWKKAFPPNGYGCRCSVTALTLKQAVAKGFKPGKEPDWVKDWAPDEGFAGIPGQPFTPDTSALPPSVEKDLKKEMKQAPPVPKVEEKPKGILSGKLDLDDNFDVPTEQKAAKERKNTAAAVADLRAVFKAVPPAPTRIISKAHKGTGSARGAYYPIRGDIYMKNGATTEAYRSTFAHEWGHHLDYMLGKAFANDAKLRSPRDLYLSDSRKGNADHPMHQFYEAAHASDALKKVRENVASARSVAHRKFYKYLESDVEVFARAISQYVAKKSGDTAFLEQVRQGYDWQKSGAQWSDDDFAPLEAALDAIFEEAGMR